MKKGGTEKKSPVKISSRPRFSFDEGKSPLKKILKVDFSLKKSLF
jgi:hypothetical protein